jgi:O-antigen/teichoic acid export membrane protein
MDKPFLNIVRLCAGDLPAKALNFFAFVYLARVLGVANYGVLEFAVSILTYFQLFADGGLELWGTREAAQGRDMRELAARIVPLRFLLALGSFCALLILLPAFPDYPALKTTVALYGLTLLAQAVDLKWVFMGREKMSYVAVGLVVGQVAFAAAVFGSVRSPAMIVWVPVLRLAADLAMAAYFFRLFRAEHGGLRLSFTLSGTGSVLRAALPMGTALGLGLMMYNIDTVLLGFLMAPIMVGWYSAAYKPVTVALAVPVTYFRGLFPALSRAHTESREGFREIVDRSLRLTSAFAVPIGVGGTFLAEPIINLLFGPDYANSVRALQVLSWSAVFVVLRGTYRQALNATGKSRLDLRCAGAAAALNLGLNLLLIPRYGIIGAAAATLVSEILWLTMAAYCFYHYVTPVSLLPRLLHPVVAGAVMGSCFLLTPTLFWATRAFLGGLVYFGVILLLSRVEVQYWGQTHKARVS